MVTQIPFDWLEEVKEELFALEAAPLLPPAHPFPAKELSEELHRKLGLTAEVEVSSATVIEKNELKEHLSPSTTRLFSFSLAPFVSPLFVAVGHEDLTKLASWLLASDMAAAVALQSSFQESFYLFTGSVAAEVITATGYFKDQALRLLSTAAVMNEIQHAVTIPVRLQAEQEVISLLIVIPPHLQKEMKSAAQGREDAFVLESVVSSKIHLTARLLFDLVTISSNDLKELQTGALLLTNKNTSTQPENVQIIIGKRAFFTGQVEGSALKITALAESSEETKKMTTPPPSPEKQLPPPPPAAPQKTPEAPPHQDATPAAADTETDPKYFLGEDEEFFVEDTELSQALQQAEKEVPPPEQYAAKESPLPAEPEAEVTSVAEIPLHIEVVVGYMRLSIKDVLAMHVGGTYTLANPVSNEVDLLINGKRIAKGELVKSGGALGVRILSL